MPERGMAETQWLELTGEVLAEGARAGRRGPEGLARALVELAILFDRAPAATTRRHGAVGSAELAEARHAAKRRLARDDHRIPFAADPAVMLLRIGAQISALDELRYELVGVEAPSDPNRDWRVESHFGDMVLIPRRKPYRAPRRRDGAARRVLQRRDLMVQHRLLPTRIGDFDLHLEWRDLAAAWPGNAKLGAALFPRLTFTEAPDGGEFLVTGIDCPGQHEQIAANLRDAHLQQCAAAVFPELTIDPKTRRHLQDELRGRLLWPPDGLPSRPSLVVAGSWHEADGADARSAARGNARGNARAGAEASAEAGTPVGAYVNVSTVFDAHGEQVLRHEKMLAFRDEELRSERIRPGKLINVLVTEEALIAFGICLDFCERQGPSPFAHLDVDYVLVPSCGNAATMAGHLATAKDLATRFRGRGFVVQQAYPELQPVKGKTPLGFVLPPTAKLDLRIADMLEFAPWSVKEAD